MKHIEGLNVSKASDITITAKPLLVDSTNAARLCGVCRRYFLQLDAQGRIPAPVRLGKRKLWSVQALQKWAAEGCPQRNRK